MSADHPQIVVVRRRSALEHEHHGGAWKIAFADFMTAMMAFFLVLWIISATDKNTKIVIARYFNPLKVEEPAKAQKGIHGAPSPDTDALGRDFELSERRKVALGPGSALQRNGSRDPGSRAQGNQAEAWGGARIEDAARSRPAQSDHVGGRAVHGPAREPRQDRRRAAAGPGIDPSAAMKGYNEMGPSLDEAIRDPFRPLGSDKANSMAATDPGAPPPGDAAEPELSVELPNPTPGGLGSQTIRSENFVSHEPQGQEGVKHEGLTPAEAASPQTKTEQPPAVDAKPAAESARSREAADLLAEVKKRLGAEAPSILGPNSTCRRPRRASSSASPTGRTSRCSRSARPSRNRA